jgi:hypothetical protein
LKALKGIYEHGRLTLSEQAPEEGPVEVLVVFPEGIHEAWERIRTEPVPRPAFAKFMRDCEEQIAQGKAEPLDMNQL